MFGIAPHWCGHRAPPLPLEIQHSARTGSFERPTRGESTAEQAAQRRHEDRAQSSLSQRVEHSCKEALRLLGRFRPPPPGRAAHERAKSLLGARCVDGLLFHTRGLLAPAVDGDGFCPDGQRTVRTCHHRPAHLYTLREAPAAAREATGMEVSKTSAATPLHLPQHLLKLALVFPFPLLA
eukprot:scaffold14004_cov111-Isochrysis_galbana.AAC.5